MRYVKSHNIERSTIQFESSFLGEIHIGNVKIT